MSIGDGYIYLTCFQKGEHRRAIIIEVNGGDKDPIRNVILLVLQLGVKLLYFSHGKLTVPCSLGELINRKHPALVAVTSDAQILLG